MKIHDVQSAALRASNGARGYAYFMEQGLGKTYTLYLDFLDRFAERNATRLVAVVPNSFKGGWVEEAEKWDLPIDPFIYESGDDSYRKFFRRNFKQPPVFICNYEAIRSPKVQDIIKEFIAGRGAMIAYDESIQLKGHNSLQTKAALSLSPEFTYKRILTGKPQTKGPHDLWGQFRAIGELNGRNYYSWKNLFCRMGGFKGKKVIGSQNEDILADMIRPFTFRALKSDWTDLPPKVYSIRNYKMTPEMERMYRSMEDDFVLWLDKQGDAVVVDQAITKYIKLAQIQAGFIIREDGSVQELVEPEHNPRVQMIKDIIEDEIEGKVIIPYVHRYSKEILTRSLAHLNPAFISGGMSDADVSHNKYRFNNEESCRVILLQMRAAKYGHTLLGGDGVQNRCSTCLVFENTYSGDDRSQIEDRIHRHGQTADCVSYIDFVATSLDKNMIRTLTQNEALYQQVFATIRNLRR